MGRIGTIEGRKNKQDAKRAKIFTKLARVLMVASREGGSDPEYNATLKTAIEKAKAANMPNDNIDRSIKKGSGELGNVIFEEIRYEGYGPGGVAVMVEVLTDNRNRAAADVRSYFNKCDGNLGSTGCVGYLFDNKGVLVINSENAPDEDEVMMQALDAGAEDFIAENGYYEIYTAVSDFGQVRDAMIAAGHNFEMAELRYLPQTEARLESPEDIKKMEKLIDLLEDHDDVQNVYHNWVEA